MDMVLPDMNGLETASELAKLMPELPVVFVSGYVDQTLLQHETGKVLLHKPLHPTVLLGQVYKILKESTTK
jgi:CheY-like chemotaxis protein